MMSILCKISLTAVITSALLLFSCGEDTPLAPPDNGEPQDSLPQDSIPTDTLPNNRTELWPLDPGMKWEYSTYYLYDEFAAGDYLTVKHWGTLTILVAEADTLAGRYQVKTFFKINEYYFYDSDDVRGVHDKYTLYHGDSALAAIAGSDTVMQYSLVLERDTLWYENEGELLFTMPLLNYPVKNYRHDYDFSSFNFWIIHEDFLYEGRPPEGFVLIFYNKEKGGAYLLEAHTGLGEASGYREDLVYRLTDYPGKPPEQ